MMSKLAGGELIKRYEKTSGAALARSERPSTTQLPGVRGKLVDDMNSAPDFAVFGPYADRTTKALSHVEDVFVGGVLSKRRFRGLAATRSGGPVGGSFELHFWSWTPALQVRWMRSRKRWKSSTVTSRIALAS